MRYKWKTKPYRHQVRAVKKLLSTGYGGALLMEPRTGKTKTIIDWLSILHQGDKVNRAIIVCPVSVMGVWEDEFAAHCPFKFKIVVWDKKARKKGILPPNKPGVLNVLLLNYDAFAVPDRRSKRGRMTIRKMLRKWAPDAMVLDESHRVKNPSAKKTYAIWSTAWEFGRSKAEPKACLIPYRAIATGTPVTKRKRLHDFYAQWKFLNPETFADLSTFDLFKDHYGVWFNRNGYEQWKRNRNVDELRERMSVDAFMVKREDCFDLPARLPDQKVWVDLEPATRKAYSEMYEEMLTQLANGEITTASIKLVQSLRLMQLTSGLAKAESGKLYALGKEKLNAAQEILADLFEADEKVVIAARFRGDIQRLVKLGEAFRIPTYRVIGGQNRRERDDHIRAFRRSQGPALIVVNPQAASLGIDLSTASTMIWYSLTNSYVDWSQTCDRIALSSKATSFIYILARDTVDEDAYDALYGDKDIAELMLERRDAGS